MWFCLNVCRVMWHLVMHRCLRMLILVLCMYEGQSISNASYFFSLLLFKKTQIQLHSLETTTLRINLSLFNIISVHFHHFGPPFNKGMYSSRVKSSRRPACHSAYRQPTLFVLQLQRRTHHLTVLTSTVASHTHFSAFHVSEWAFHLLQSRIQSQNAV